MVMSIMYRSLLFAFRKERLRLLLFAFALLAAGCAHDGSDASDERPHHHGGHRGGRGGEQSFTNPSPTPSGFRSTCEPNKDPNQERRDGDQASVNDPILEARATRGFSVGNAGECNHGVERQINSGERGFEKMIELLFRGRSCALRPVVALRYLPRIAN